MYNKKIMDNLASFHITLEQSSINESMTLVKLSCNGPECTHYQNLET